MEIRSFTSPYLRAVDDYLSTLFAILVPLQVLDKLPIVLSNLGKQSTCNSKIFKIIKIFERRV